MATQLPSSNQLAPDVWRDDKRTIFTRYLAGAVAFDDIGSRRKGIGVEGKERVTAVRIVVPLVLAVASALAVLAIGPRAFEAQVLLAAQDDPAALADYAVARSFDATVAAREIDAALAAGDADLALSFLDLAREWNVPIDPTLVEKVERANAKLAVAARSFGSFARGLATGEADDVSGFAGTAVGDLFVLGDIRDLVREGARLASGDDADEVVLALAGAGLAVTAGTYAMLGAAAPARVGLTLVKAARKTGRLGRAMAAWINRSLREMVDWTALKGTVSARSLAQPAAAARTMREAIRVEKAQPLLRFVGDVGRVQASAGTRAALDGLKLAEGPRDVSKLARLAAAKGGKTRAILKLAGRSAIVLAVGAFDLAMWLFWALVTLLGFVTSLKRMTEAIAQRSCMRRKLRRARRAHAQSISQHCVLAH
jgi:hypothetical protein